MIVYGKQVVFYILEKYPKIINKIYLAKDIDKVIFRKFSKLNKTIIRPDSMKAQSLARGGNHQGFLLEIEEYAYATITQIKQYNFILVLHELTDMGNIGAIVRTAHALGVDAIVISGIKKLNTAAIIRTSSGAMLDMPIVVIQNSLDIINEFKQINFSLLGADIDGIELNRELKYKCKDKIALFVGNENSGIPRKILSKFDYKVKIPMKNNFNSLNVSVAAGILIYSLR